MNSNKRRQKFLKHAVRLEIIKRAIIAKKSDRAQNPKIASDSILLLVTHAITSISSSPNAKRDLINILFEFFQKQIQVTGLAYACQSFSGDFVVEFGRGTWLNLTGLYFERDAGAISQVLHQREILHGQLVPFEQDLAREPAGMDPGFSICLPVIAEEQLLGAVWIERMQPLSRNEMMLAKYICEIAAASFYRILILQQNQAATARMAVINRLSRTLTETDSLQDISILLADAVYELLPNVEEILISHIEQRTESIRYIYTGNKKHVLAEDALPRMPLSPFDQELQTRIFKSAKSVLIAQLPEVTDMTILIGSPSRLTHSAMYIPMQSNGKVIGILQVHRNVVHSFNSEDEALSGLLANIGATAIENFLKVYELRQKETDLEQSYETMLDAWERILVMRDIEIEEHTRRVCELTIKMAKAIGYPEEGLAHLRRGSLLHDIGKIAIPDKILNKPGPLNEDEWKIMHKHPVYAYQLLSPIPFPRPTLEIPYCHHEKWDGSGYPRRLKGEEIPLSARLFSVVDVWDALTSHRPYRAAWPKNKAVQYLIEQSGQSFDPQVVNLFLSLHPDPETGALYTMPVEKIWAQPLNLQFVITNQGKANGFT